MAKIPKTLNPPYWSGLSQWCPQTLLVVGKWVHQLGSNGQVHQQNTSVSDSHPGTGKPDCPGPTGTQWTGRIYQRKLKKQGTKADQAAPTSSDLVCTKLNIKTDL